MTRRNRPWSGSPTATTSSSGRTKATPTAPPTAPDRTFAAAIMSGNGTVVVPEFIVNTTTANDQRDPAIALLSDGNFIVTWTSDVNFADSDVRGRVFSPTGVPLGPDFLIDGEADSEFDSAVPGSPTAPMRLPGRIIQSAPSPRQMVLEPRSRKTLHRRCGDGDQRRVHRQHHDRRRPAQGKLTTLADGRLVATWTDIGGTLGDERSRHRRPDHRPAHRERGALWCRARRRLCRHWLR